jgi:hypothetical protein
VTEQELPEHDTLCDVREQPVSETRVSPPASRPAASRAVRVVEVEGMPAA